MGVHIANEVTAPLDFDASLKTFQTDREFYGLRNKNDSMLNFSSCTMVEVSHREKGAEMVRLYTEGDPERIDPSGR